MPATATEFVIDSERAADDLISEAIDLFTDKYREQPHAVRPRKRQENDT